MKFQLDCSYLPFTLDPSVCQLFERAAQVYSDASFLELVPIRFDSVNNYFLQASITNDEEFIFINEVAFGQRKGGKRISLLTLWNDPSPSDLGFKLLKNNMPKVETVQDAFILIESWVLDELDFEGVTAIKADSSICRHTLLM